MKAFFAALACFLALTAHADETLAQAHFEAGNVLLGQGEPAAALTEYETALAQGTSPALLLNYGNAWFALGEPARAAVAYEQALALAPNHPEARHNRALALERLGLAVPTPAWWQGWALGLAAAFWQKLFFGSILLVALLIALKLAGWRVPLTGFWLVCGLLIALFSGTALGLWDRELAQGRMIATAELRIAPTADSPTSLTVPIGRAATLERRLGDYFLVRLAEGVSGYVTEAEYAPLVPPPLDE